MINKIPSTEISIKNSEQKDVVLRKITVYISFVSLFLLATETILREMKFLASFTPQVNIPQGRF